MFWRNLLPPCFWISWWNCWSQPYTQYKWRGRQWTALLSDKHSHQQSCTPFFWHHLSDLFGSILLCRGGHVYSLVLQTPESLSFYASQNHMKIYMQPFTFFTFFIFIYFQIWIVQYIPHNHVWTSAITTFCGGVGYFMMYQVQRFFLTLNRDLSKKPNCGEWRLMEAMTKCNKTVCETYSSL